MEDSLRAYDWIRLAEQVREQLASARAKLAEAGEHEREQRWLSEADALLSGDAEAREKLLARARRLPELAAVRQEHAADLIGPWVDALEHLHAGIVYHAGLKSPLLEALFPHRKFDGLRRANLDNAQSYGADFQRRLSSSYLERLLARDEFAFARPSVDDVTARFAALSSDGGEPEDSAELAKELAAHAQEAELALKQARLLIEAALVPVPGFFEELAIRSKPKTRSAKKEAVKETEPEAPVEAKVEEPRKKAKEKAQPKEKPAAKRSKKKPSNAEASA
jgi:hypothetical protein